MESVLVYPVGNTPASHYAAETLKASGVPVIDHPSPEITHLLLDVPSFAPDGALRGGGEIQKLLAMLPPNVSVAGGNLNHPALAGYDQLDLLADPQYVATNAAITADCALQIAAGRLPIVYAGCPVLIIGWGRIGKCLGQMLKALGAEVTVGARKASDRAMLTALGYEAADTAVMGKILSRFRVIFNTAPEAILSGDEVAQCANAVKIDLASNLVLPGDDVIWAKGLPGMYAPESSGKLIAGTLLKFLREAET